MQLQRSYHGNVMMLKRDAGAQDVVAQVIYKGDTFKQKWEKQDVSKRLNTNKTSLTSTKKTLSVRTAQSYLMMDEITILKS